MDKFDQMLAQLETMYPNLSSIRASSLQHLRDSFKVKTFQKGDCAQKSGQITADIGIVLSGLFRLGGVKANGAVFTIAYMGEGSLLADYLAMKGLSQAQLEIEALEPSILGTISLEAHEKVRQEDPVWANLTLFILEHQLARVAAREYELLTMTPWDRWISFRKANPHIAPRLAQLEVARYLGVSSVSLSRLLAREKRKSRLQAT
jgi:CRP-like cAMP-binding protein